MLRRSSHSTAVLFLVLSIPPTALASEDAAKDPAAVAWGRNNVRKRKRLQPARCAAFRQLWDRSGRHGPLAVKPGNDFFRYVDGRWLATEKIPPDRTTWGSFYILQEQADSDVKAIIETAAAADAPKGTNEQKIGDYYKAFLDTDKIDQLGLAPAKAGLATIAGIKTHEQAAALIATPGMPLNGPIGYGISLDEKNPDRYIVGMGSPA